MLRWSSVVVGTGGRLRVRHVCRRCLDPRTTGTRQAWTLMNCDLANANTNMKSRHLPYLCPPSNLPAVGTYSSTEEPRLIQVPVRQQEIALFGGKSSERAGATRTKGIQYQEPSAQVHVLANGHYSL